MGEILKLASCGWLLVCACVFTGCFSWTEDSQGHLTSVGLPGVPVWQAQPGAATAQPMNPVDAGFTPEEAAKMSGLVMVLPPAPPSKAWRYRYYQTGQNHCEDDLKKALEARAQSGETGPAPYCTTNPAAPTARDNASIF
jgi:hypothetical protein